LVARRTRSVRRRLQQRGKEARPRAAWDLQVRAPHPRAQGAGGDARCGMWCASGCARRLPHLGGGLGFYQSRQRVLQDRALHVHGSSSNLVEQVSGGILWLGTRGAPGGGHRPA
jgi:hypothetical protein